MIKKAPIYPHPPPVSFFCRAGGKRRFAVFAPLALALAVSACDVAVDEFDNTTWEASLMGADHLLAFHDGAVTYTIKTLLGVIQENFQGIYSAEGGTATISFDNGAVKTAQLAGENLTLFTPGSTAAIVFTIR
jgi:hypothetical protein